MPRAGERNIAKEQHWRQIIADQQASGLSVAEYCRRKGIVVGLLYEWKRRIRERDAEQSTSNRQCMAARAKQIAKSAKRENQRSVEFAELQFVDREQTRTLPGSPAMYGDMLEVVFTSGTKVRLSAGCSLELFASVVNLLENR